MAKANEIPGFEHIHYFLVDALRALDRSHWPARFHLGGPLPVLTYAAQPRVAHAVALDARRFAADTTECNWLIDLATNRARQISRAELDKATKGNKADEPALKIARLYARTVFNFMYAAQSAKNVIGKCVTNAVLAHAQSFPEPWTLLDLVDQAIVGEELRDKLAERSIEPSSRIVRVLSRPAATKSFALVLARLANGDYGIYVKLKTWQWHEGDRATVFATVPDAYMEHVAADLG